jgi:hypothetical protein
MAQASPRLRHKTSAWVFLATALAHLHVRYHARRNRHAANDNIFSDSCS